MIRKKRHPALRDGSGKLPRLNPVAVVALRRFRCECIDGDIVKYPALSGFIAAADVILDYEEAATDHANRTRQGATP